MYLFMFNTWMIGKLGVPTGHQPNNSLQRTEKPLRGFPSAELSR
jgi:hypothetical protein